MKILVVNTYPSWGASVELVQHISGLTSIRSQAEIPDSMEFKEVESLKLFVQERGIGAVIFDNHWVPAKLVPLTFTLLQIADQLRTMEVEVFYLNNQNRSSPTHARARKSHGAMLYGHDFDCELWRALKSVQLEGEAKPSLRTIRVAQFLGNLFDVETGKAKQRYFGDDGEQQVMHWVQNGYAFWERDWPSITEAIKRELSS